MTFKPGESGNPNGRPEGAENKLTKKAKYYAEKFLDEIDKQGISQIAATGKMTDFINIIKALLPKDMNVNLSGQVDVPPSNIIIDGKLLTDDKS